MPQKDPLNKNNALNIVFILSIEVTSTFLTTALFLCPNIIYKRLTLTAIYYINLLVIIPNLYLISVLYLINPLRRT